MFSKSALACLTVLFITAQSVHGHAAIAPVLGLGSTAPVRNDVQRPSAAAECGSTDIATALAKSTAVPIAANGSFTTTITNFNGGQDGSRQVTLKVDGTATGQSFVAGTVQVNGDLAPPAAGSQQIVASVPAGTQCTGGASKNLCLASFTTAGGFGNCVVLSQAAAGAANATAANATASAVNGTAIAANGTASAANGTPIIANGTAANATAVNATAANLSAVDATAVKGAEHKKGKGKGKGKEGKAARSGTLLPRALLEDIEARGEEGMALVQRNLMSWIWA